MAGGVEEGMTSWVQYMKEVRGQARALAYLGRKSVRKALVKTLAFGVMGAVCTFHF